VPLDDLFAHGKAHCLDVGAGMGLWVIEMASDFPESTFIGVDKEKTFPTTAIPSNVKFSLMDATEPWQFEDGIFDLIGQRSLMGGYKEVQWPFVLKEAFRCLKPGGWIQFLEPHIVSYRSSENTITYCNWVVELLASQGYNGLIYKKLPQLLYETGFQEIEEFVISIPFGSWGGTVGTLIKDDAAGWASKWKPALSGQLNIDSDVYDKMHHALLTDCEPYKSYVSFSCFIAQKPQKPPC